MCPARVHEPIYHAIKELLLDGSWPWGSRLEPIKIADMLSITTSITPIREALHRLAAEGLVSFIPSQGFHVPRINEAELRHLFEHNQDLLLAAIKSSSKNSSAILADGAYPDRASNIFLQVAKRSGNRALSERISRLNDLLHQFRRCDPKLFQDADSELEDIIAAANDEPAGARLRQLITRYHDRRIAEVERYIRLMTSDLV